MSYDVIVWEGPTPTDDRAAAATCRAIQRAIEAQTLEDADPLDPSPAIDAFLADLSQAHPDIDERMTLELSRWPRTHETSNVVTLNLVLGDEPDDVLETIATLAGQHHLTMVDLQLDDGDEDDEDDEWDADDEEEFTARPKKKLAECLPLIERDEDDGIADWPEEAVQIWLRRLHEAQRPILEELRSVGVDVADSVGELEGVDIPQAALLVVLKHLERGGYPPAVMGRLGSVMGRPEALPYWDQLVQIFHRTHTDRAASGLASTLEFLAQRKHVDDLMGMLARADLPFHRGLFIAKVLRWGGEPGRRIVEEILDDPSPTVRRNAKDALRRRPRRKS